MAHLQSVARKPNLADSDRNSVGIAKSPSGDDQTVSSADSSVNVSQVLASENKNAIWLSKRPVLKAFFNHVIMLLGLLPFADYDGYIRELQASLEDCMGAQRYKRAVAAAHYAQQYRKNVVMNPHGPCDNASYGSTMSSFADVEDRTAAVNGRFFWEEEGLKPEDLQLKSLLHELATQTCFLHSPLQIEAKMERLTNAYFSLRVRTQRSAISFAIQGPHFTDPQRCVQFFDLFAINFFNSDTFHTHMHPHPQFLQHEGHHGHHSPTPAESQSTKNQSRASNVLHSGSQTSLHALSPNKRSSSGTRSTSFLQVSPNQRATHSSHDYQSPPGPHQQAKKEQRARLVLQRSPSVA